MKDINKFQFPTLSKLCERLIENQNRKTRNIAFSLHLYLFLLFFSVIGTISSGFTSINQSSNDFLSTNNWYVGNTEAGEWIQFRKVWLSAGQYRFTTQAVASLEEQTVHVELNGQILKNGVVIPTNDTGEFELTHLGYRELAEGYYDIKLVFETGNVNCDMIFIRKSINTGSTVIDDDIAYSINRNDGMHIAPIGGAWTGSAFLAKGGDRGDDVIWEDLNGNDYTRKQVLSWNKQQIYAYTPEITDQAVDMYVSEQVEAKVDFIFSHGRGETDVTNDIEDRDYIAGPGAFGCRQLVKLVDAINRNSYAKDNMKIAYFCDNAVFPIAVKKYLGKEMNWGDPECQQFLWDYCFRTFYETVPRSMLFERSPGVVPIQFWSASANYNYTTGDNKILEFLQFIEIKMEETFGLKPSFILAKDFFSRDSRVTEIADGVQAWFSWGNSNISFEYYDGKTYGFALNGGRYPLRNVWYNDWNPDTNTGTHSLSSADYHQSSLTTNGAEAIRPIYEYGASKNFEWLVNESWFDWREGSTWYRSNHPEYAWPNQYISLEREFADRESGSILLEAEACDEFYDLSLGNSGGAYRVNWYKDLDKDFYTANMSIDLDIYRPLHKLSDIQEGGNPGIPVTNISAGLHDVWTINEQGKIYCQEIDGKPIEWKQINQALPNVKKLALGRFYAWALTSDNKVMMTGLPAGWSTNGCTGWNDVSGGYIMKDLDISMNRVWAIDNNGEVYYRDLNANRNWTKVIGKLNSITADDEFVWGIAPNDSIVCMSVQSKSAWDTVPNPHKLITIEAGATEVWGINEQKEVYRMNSAGDGSWEYVTSGYSHVSVGYEYTWLADDAGNMYYYSMKGFENRTIFSDDKSMHNPTDIESPVLQSTSLKVFPNPFLNSLNIEYFSENTENATIRIYDLTGHVIYENSRVLSVGYNEFKISNLDGVLTGVYILEIKTATRFEHQKIMKKILR